jgi:hypothetical protein
MKVVGHKSPRKTGRIAVGQETAESIQKIVTVRIVKKYLSPINPPHNDMVQRSRGVYASFAWHVNHVSKIS